MKRTTICTVESVRAGAFGLHDHLLDLGAWMAEICVVTRPGPGEARYQVARWRHPTGPFLRYETDAWPAAKRFALTGQEARP